MTTTPDTRRAFRPKKPRPIASYAVATAMFAAPLTARGETPPDVVELHDGSFVRGTIVERVAGGDVEIQLANGETRHFAMRDVVFAGPERDFHTTVVAPIAVPAPSPEVTMRVALAPASLASGHRVTLHRLTGTVTSPVLGRSGITLAQLDSFVPLCTAPCTAHVPSGTQYLGVSLDDGSVIRASNGPFTLDRDVFATVEYRDRTALHTAGWITLATMVLGGFAVVFSSFAAGIGSHDTDSIPTFVGVGGAMALTGLAVGIPMLVQRDTGTITFAPAIDAR